MIISELIAKLYRLKYLAGDIAVIIERDDLRYDEFSLEVHHGDDDCLVICPIDEEVNYE